MLFHNLDETIGENDKISFLQQYRFNICPENTLEKGYVTEKLVDAIQGGCVPIYRGMLDEWDKQIFNKEAIIYI
ncbi:MAG: hypothetical protein LBU27_09650 [Candidatus Peribacteria bacterium]|jgi:hypothetical protein|nr:hypothetical protein [Candidatus Peribacteria bacterium]